MRKNRNSFFSENNMNFQGYNSPIPNMQYQNYNSANTFYAGNMPLDTNNDFVERLSKIERQINRLEHRINKLENGIVQNADDYDSNTNNMYMI
jgi:hypothetical protein